MKIDDSFKKPGSVPFKWEIRPGVPKLQNPPTPSMDRLHTGFGSERQHQRKQKQVQKNQSPITSPFQETPRRLKPPPAGLYYQPPLEPLTHTRTHSFRSFSRRFDLSGLARPGIASSVGCFPSSLGKLKNGKRSVYTSTIPEPDYYSDLETHSRWSNSSRKSISSLSTSFPSHQSSPRLVSDADWASFGLF